MEIELSDLLSSFESAAARLNDTSDSVNSILGAIEKRLIAANVGLESWLRSPLTQSDATGSTGGETSWIDQRLGFAKVGGKWCLAVKPICHVSGFFEGDTNCPFKNEYTAGDPTPLLQAPRHIRIEALRLISELIAQLRDQASAATDTIELAKAHLSK